MKKEVVRDFLKARPEMTLVNHSGFVKALQQLKSQGFFRGEQSHELAKEVFAQVLGHFGLSVDFPTANEGNANDQQQCTKSYNERPKVGKPMQWIKNDVDGSWVKVADQKTPLLDPNIFYASISKGVEKDIPNAALDSQNRIHLFSVASQYNGSEAPNPMTPKIGNAMATSEWDHTQGPLAQRTNPVLFESVTAFLTHLGFNMMEYALPLAGKTFRTRNVISHGYLRPTNSNIESLTRQLETKYTSYETVCYQTRYDNVYLILGAAPAIGYSSSLTKSSKELEYFAHLANFSAMFHQIKTLMKRFPKRDIVLHVTGVGLGVFGCHDTTFAEAFFETARTFQNELSSSRRDDEEGNNVYVQLEVMATWTEIHWGKLHKCWVWKNQGLERNNSSS